MDMNIVKNKPEGSGGGRKASNFETFEVIRCYKSRTVNRPHDLIIEAPLVIRIDGRTYATVMRTPGEETFHVAGFCLSEGIIDDLNDLESMDLCNDMDTDVVEVRLAPEKLEKTGKIPENKNLLSLSSCGICRRELPEDTPGFLKKL